MSSPLRRLVVVAVTVSCAPSAASAGAFTLREGELKLFVSGLVMTGDHYFDRRGKLRPRGTFKKRDLQTFAEYGVTDVVTVFGSTTLQRITTSGEERARRTGLGRTEFGARLRLRQDGPWIVSAQTSLIIAGAKRRDGLAAIGETDDQFDVRGLVARSFTAFERPGFFDLQVGYRTRSGDPADEIRVDATLGYRLHPRWLLLAQSFNTFGQEEWKGRFPLKQRIHKLQGAMLFDVTPAWTLHAALFATPEARDALEERGVIVGVGYRF